MQPLRNDLPLRYRFGRFVVDPQELCLFEDGVAVPLTRKTFDTLLYLVQNPGRLIPRQELIQAVWPDAIVEEGNLHWTISGLRKALGSTDRGEKGLIQTVHGAGYRFRAEVEVESVERRSEEPGEEALLELFPDPVPAPSIRADTVPIPTAVFPAPARAPASPSKPRRLSQSWILASAVLVLAALAGLLAWRLSQEVEQVSRPVSPEATELHREGVRLLRAGDPIAAKRVLSKATLAEPSFAPARSALAQALAELGEEQAAEQEALKAVQSSAGLPEPERLEIQARHHALTHHWDEAIALYQHLWRSDPDSVDPGIALAEVQLQAGRHAGASATVARLKALPPAEGGARIDLLEGAIAEEVSDFRRALRAAAEAEARAQSPASAFLRASAQLRQAQALYGLRKPEEARQKIAEARQSAAPLQSPGLQVRIVQMEGAICLLTGDFDGAVEKYEESLERYERLGSRKPLPGLLFHLAYVRTMRGELGIATARLEQALASCVAQEDAECQASAHTELGHLALNQGETTRAREHFEISDRIAAGGRSAKRESRNLEGLLVVAETLGDLRGAERWARKKLALDRSQRDFWNAFKGEAHLANLLIEQDRPREALDLLLAAEARPENAGFRDTRAYAAAVKAESLLRLGRLQEAEAESLRALELIAGQKNVYVEISVLFSRASVLRGMGRLEEARGVAAALLEKTREARFQGWELDAKLLSAELILDSGDRKLARQLLQDLLTEARAKSDGAVVRKVEKLLAGVPQR